MSIMCDSLDYKQGVSCPCDLIAVIRNEMYVETSRFTNVGPQIKKLWVIFTHSKLWVTVARHNFKWVKK